jgi:hypothetical protein
MTAKRRKIAITIVLSVVILPVIQKVMEFITMVWRQFWKG